MIEMIWWTGLAPWEFESTFPGSLVSTFPNRQVHGMGMSHPPPVYIHAMLGGGFMSSIAYPPPRVTSLIKNRLPPRVIIGIVLLKGPTGPLFLMSEVSL